MLRSNGKIHLPGDNDDVWLIKNTFLELKEDDGDTDSRSTRGLTRSASEGSLSLGTFSGSCRQTSFMSDSSESSSFPLTETQAISFSRNQQNEHRPKFREGSPIPPSEGSSYGIPDEQCVNLNYDYEKCHKRHAAPTPKSIGGVSLSQELRARQQKLGVATSAETPNRTMQAGKPLELSKGSLLHLQAPVGSACTPCVFYFRGLCVKGTECRFCHFKHKMKKPKRLRASKRTRALLAEQSVSQQLSDDEEEAEDEMPEADVDSTRFESATRISL